MTLNHKRPELMFTGHNHLRGTARMFVGLCNHTMLRTLETAWGGQSLRVQRYALPTESSIDAGLNRASGPPGW